MDWLEEELGGYDDDYLIFDCPGMSWLSRRYLLYSKADEQVCLDRPN
jgi:hypothetical protein